MDPKFASKISNRIKRALKSDEDLICIKNIFDENAYKIACICKEMLESGISKMAVDQNAKDYWVAYYGTYGDALVTDVKKRIIADLNK